MSFLHDGALRAEGDHRMQRVREALPRRRPSGRRADRLAAREAVAAQSLVEGSPGAAAAVPGTAELAALIEAHIRVPGPRAGDRLPQQSLVRPGQ